MNKCDGIKILELDPKRILEGNEYMVIAEKDQNFKAPINQIVDLVVSDDRLKNYIDTTIESSIGDFKNEVNHSISTAFGYGYVAGNSEKRGQQFIRSYVSSRDGQAADEEFAVVNYFDKTEAGQVVALNPIT